MTETVKNRLKLLLCEAGRLVSLLGIVLCKGRILDRPGAENVPFLRPTCKRCKNICTIQAVTRRQRPSLSSDVSKPLLKIFLLLIFVPKLLAIFLKLQDPRSFSRALTCFGTGSNQLTVVTLSCLKWSKVLMFK